MKLYEIIELSEYETNILVEGILGKMSPKLLSKVRKLSTPAKKIVAAGLMAGMLTSAPAKASERDLQAAETLMNFADAAFYMNSSEFEKAKQELDTTLKGVPDRFIKQLQQARSQDEMAEQLETLAQRFLDKHEKDEEIKHERRQNRRETMKKVGMVLKALGDSMAKDRSGGESPSDTYRDYQDRVDRQEERELRRMQMRDLRARERERRRY